MDSHLDAVERRIVSAARRVNVICDQMMDRSPEEAGEEKFMDRFEQYVFKSYHMKPVVELLRYRVVKTQWSKLKNLGQVQSVTGYEYEKACVADVLENVDEARIQFEVCLYFIVYY